MRKQHTFVYIAFLCLSLNYSYGQWTKPKGKGYYKLSAWYLKTDQHFTDTGNIDPNATRTYFNTNFFGEYGITDTFNVMAYVPFFARTAQNAIVSGTTGEVIRPGEAVNSIGDIDIGFIYRLWRQKSWSLSATLKLGLPTGEDAGGSDGSFQTGDGEFNQLLQLNIGTSFKIGTLNSYGKAYAGFNNRTNGFSDEFKTGAEIGSNIIKQKLWLIVKTDLNSSLRNGTRSAENAQGNIFANNVEYLNLGGELAYYISNKVGISFNYTSALFGRIIAANPSITGGVFLVVR